MADIAPALTALLERHGVSVATAGPTLRALLDRLARDDAPTSVHEPTAALNVHIADSLAGLEVSAIRSARLIADLGSGAGLPGLALAAVRPDSHVVLVESVARKCRFLRETVAALGVGNVEIVCARVEDWTAGRERCDVVCARALAALPVLCEYAAPLLREGGVLVAWKGDVDAAEASDGRAAAAHLGLEHEAVVAVSPYAGSERRTLHILRKVAPTPASFPRRPGIATKRPLTAKSLR